MEEELRKEENVVENEESLDENVEELKTPSHRQSRKGLVRKITTLAMLAAIAYALAFLGHTLGIHFVPSVPFLSYDPKDIVVCIGGFILGPLGGALISVVVSFIEMITISSTGFYGFIMNIFSTCSFVVPAALIYKYRKSFKGALFSLLIGFVCEILVMTLWNIIITPIYMGVARDVLVKNYLLPIVLFNVIKVGINVGLVLILYKPIITGLRSIGLIEKGKSKFDLKSTLLMVGLGLFVLATFAVVIILLKNS